MTPNQMKQFIRYDTAMQVWDAIKKTYSDGSDEAKIYDLHKRSFTMKQNGAPIANYYSNLTEIFQELDQLSPTNMKHPNDISSRQQEIERLRVYIFLAGLDNKFDQIRGEILRMEPKPGLEIAYSHVKHESNRQGTVSESATMPEATVYKGRKKESSRASFTTSESFQDVSSSDHVPKALNTSSISNSTSANTCNRSWIIDTGATDHMTSDASILHSLKTANQTFITSANGSISPVTGEDSLSLTSSLNLDHVLVDLLTRAVIGCGTRRGKLYYLDLTEECNNRLSQVHHVSRDESTRMKKIWLWHRRLGHPSFGYLKLLFPQLFPQFKESDFHCEICILAKSYRVSYPLRLNKSFVPFMVVHSDVWGPARILTISGFRWFVTFIDDCTRMTWVFPMKLKSEVPTKFNIFHQYIATQFDKKIQTLRSDNGGEYVNHAPHNYLQEHDIVHQTTCAYTPQQNGVAEKKNRHLLEVVRASLYGANMHYKFWGEALCSTTYLINPTPSSTLQYQTPLQTLNHLLTIPSISNLESRVFGCVAYVQVYPHQWGKFDPCAFRCVFLGYSDTKKGYKCFHPPTQTLYIIANVQFQEGETYFAKGDIEYPLQEDNSMFEKDTQDISNIKIVAEISETEINVDKLADDLPHDQSAPEHNQQVTNQSNSIEIVSESSQIESTNYQLPPRKSRGIPKQLYDPDPRAKVKYPIANHVSLHRLSTSCEAFINQLSTVSIPCSVEDAMKDARWTCAMNEEMEALQKNFTWELTNLPKGKKSVGCRWIYTVKFNADGIMEQYKARLVAKGYTQTYDIDYRENFAPVPKISTIRVLLSLTANLDWPLQQFDVKNAFLHGDLEK
ncbi:hypothetical protein ACFX12_011118 [Malus domestica]